MLYPSNTQYLESISNSEGLFCTLSGVDVVDETYCSGNFGTVFRITTDQGDRALKCFTRPQHGRLAAYEKIAEAIRPSEYIVEYRYLNDEIFVYDDDNQECGRYYPVLLMDWVDGQTLGKHIERAIYRNDMDRVRELAVKFDELSSWLLDQSFAMGDLKPDNIMVRHEDDRLVLIDYDGMFVDSMAGERAREFGTEPFQSSSRMSAPFDRNIDNYSIAYIRKAFEVILLSPDRYCPSSLVEFTADELLSFEECDRVFGSKYQYMGNSSEGVMIYREGELYGFIHSDGTVLTDAVFGAVQDFSADGLAAVSIGSKWGYIDRAGRVAIALRYDSCSPFSESKAAVCVGGKWGYVDMMGRALSRMMFDDAWRFRNGLALVRRGGKYGFLGEDGRVVIPLKFDFAQSFTTEGLACVMVGGKYGYIGQNGKWWAKPVYDYAQSFRNSRAAVELGGREFFLDFE